LRRGYERTAKENSLHLVMIHAFLLFVFVGIGEEKKLESNDMYFRDVNECTYFARQLHKQGQKITAYCVPRLVDKDTRVY
tara:strand:+ start:1362 stop:1601 length:240 start_codon:yes stop_codon:yes gene_type:complete